MNFLKFFFIIFFIFIFLANCTKQEKVSVIEDKDVELQMIDAFKVGYKEFESGDILFAAKNFNEA